MSNALILIPARYGSSRFPGKPLAKINGKPMIQHVIENCRDSGYECAAVTDDDRIEKFLKENNLPVVRVDDEVSTGSERIALAYKRHFSQGKFDFIVNVQGDEPLLGADILKELVAFHHKSEFDICTAVKKRENDEEDYANPNIVKCAYAKGACLYFSRASIPFFREGGKGFWHQHIGLYSYRPEALEAFTQASESELEMAEKLEQLRAMEIGLTIGAIETQAKMIGVDTPEDIHRIEGVLSGQKR